MTEFWKSIPNLLPLRRRRGRRRRPGIRRSLFVRHVDGGSSNIIEAELASVVGAVHNLAGYGIRFVASPRHADVLLLTGPLTRNMLGPAWAAFEAMPEPRMVVTVGDDDPEGLAAAFRRSYAAVDLPAAMSDAVVDHIPGDPPEPQMIIDVLVRVAKLRASRRWRRSALRVQGWLIGGRVEPSEEDGAHHRPPEQ
jgi:Ni,Fe-hydrogenase III small subunit